LVIGSKLGQGGYCTAHEITSFHLPKEQEESTAADMPHNETQTRGYMSKYCIRDGDSRYAIKKLKSEVRSDKKLFFSGTVDLALEIKFLAIIQHPHIIKMRAISTGDFFKDGAFIIMDRLYDTMEVRVRKWKQKDSRFKSICGNCMGGQQKSLELMTEKVRVALDLANALSFLHEKKIVYRDLKPENIGFDVRDDVKLFDFGLAKELIDSPSNKNEDGTYNLTGFTGSVVFMAPEVALNKPYNLSADVYSFGILLWFMMAADFPYPNLSMNSIIKLVAKEGKRPPCNKTWPEDLSSLMNKCWSEDICERPDFVDIMSALLGEYCQMTTSEYDGMDLDVSRNSLNMKMNL